MLTTTPQPCHLVVQRRRWVVSKQCGFFSNPEWYFDSLIILLSAKKVVQTHLPVVTGTVCSFIIRVLMSLYKKHFRLSCVFICKGTHVRAFAICLNMKNGFYRLFLGQNLKSYILSMILKSKITFHSDCRSCMNDFNACIFYSSWYSKQNEVLFKHKLYSFPVAKLCTNHTYFGR